MNLYEYVGVIRSIAHSSLPVSLGSSLSLQLTVEAVAGSPEAFYLHSWIYHINGVSAADQDIIWYRKNETR